MIYKLPKNRPSESVQSPYVVGDAKGTDSIEKLGNIGSTGPAVAATVAVFEWTICPDDKS